MSKTVAGIAVPDSPMARAATELVRDVESELLFHHSSRVFLFGALSGEQKALRFDSELLYIGAMFHDIGLTDAHRHSHDRFEVDGANAARQFLRGYRIAEQDIADVWDAIALHTTPGIAQHKRPVVALVTTGVEVDVLGLHFDEFTVQQREEVVKAHPREEGFKRKIIECFGLGIAHRPASTFGTVHADVMDRVDPKYRRLNYCGLILGSDWPD
jgi:HD domain